MLQLEQVDMAKRHEEPSNGIFLVYDGARRNPNRPVMVGRDYILSYRSNKKKIRIFRVPMEYPDARI